ncbi:hypothetical protein FPQ18DRAFT_303467 [Pyronema domesticum]|nr:hypothetical protein FPQ18DRAFT_303467 [Pyronema domesticum]
MEYIKEWKRARKTDNSVVVGTDGIQQSAPIPTAFERIAKVASKLNCLRNGLTDSDSDEESIARKPRKLKGPTATKTGNKGTQPNVIVPDAGPSRVPGKQFHTPEGEPLVSIVRKVDQNALPPTLRLVPRTPSAPTSKPSYAFRILLPSGPLRVEQEQSSSNAQREKSKFPSQYPLALIKRTPTRPRRKDSATIQQDNTGPADFAKQFLLTR